MVPFVGVAGTPGGGKTYFAENVRKLLEERHGINAIVVPMDGYHYYRKQLDKFDDPEEAHARRGAAFTFDAERFVADVEEANRSHTFKFPSFDHAKKDPEEAMIEFDKNKHDAVIIEGLYVLLDYKPWSVL